MDTRSTLKAIIMVGLLFPFLSTAQTVGISGNGAYVPNANSILDLDDDSGTKGALLPRMSAAQRGIKGTPHPGSSTGFTASLVVGTADEGLTIFNTSTNQYNYWDGTDWQIIPNSTSGNTLDDAYDEGGAGVGRTITADNGAVHVSGTDGLHVDGDVGIGTTTPSVALEVRDDDNTNGQLLVAPTAVNAQDAMIVIRGARDNTAPSSTARLQFENYDNNALPTPTTHTLGSMEGQLTNSTTNVGDIVFRNSSDGLVASLTETMRLTKDGKVDINDLASGLNGAVVTSNSTGVLNEVNFSGLVTDVLRGDGTFGPAGVGLGDNLGNHTATTDLDMDDNAIVDIDWATSDDGAGSELDADLLDGQQGTYYLDNTDNQDLSLSSNTLSLTNDGTPVDLSGYLDNTDNQDLSLSGNTLSLTNDGTPVDLSAYLDADDLGNHTATTDLNMANNAITNIDWATSDDGAGSELDADLLDGQQGTYYLDADNHVYDGGSTLPASSTEAAIDALDAAVNAITDATTASNGLTEVGDDIRLGGTLTQNTTIDQGGFTMDFTASSVDAFSVDGTTFSVDASNNRVGIGDAAPQGALEVVGDIWATESSDNSLRIRPGMTAGNQYGFADQHNNLMAFVNEQGTTNQAFVLGDVDATSAATLFGISVATGGSNPTSGAEAGWSKRFEVDGNGTVSLSTYTTNGLLKTTGGNGTLAIATGADLPTGSNNYIQNQVAVNQSAGFRIDGNGLFNGGSVGIGTTGPAAPLDVRGEVHLNTMPGYQSEGQIRIGRADGTARYHLVKANNDGTAGNNYITFAVHNGTVSSTNDVLTLRGDRKVGIGNTAPDEELHVEGEALIDLYQQGDASGLFFREGFTTSNVYNLGLLVHDDGDGSPDALDIAAFDGIYFNTGANTRNPRMVVTQGGGVGIGTTAPSTQLHTTGGVRFAGIGASGSNTEILTVDGSGNVTTRPSGSWTGGADNLGNHIATQNVQLNSNWLSNDGGNEGIQVSNVGNVQITGSGTIGLTTLTNGWLKIGSTLAMDDNEIHFGTDGHVGTIGAFDLIFRSNGDERMRLLSGGNFGVGTNNPGATLHVSNSSSEVIRAQSSGAEADIHYINNNTTWQVGTNNNGNGTSNNHFYIYDNAYRLTVQKGTGNVGIGTTTPGARLNVQKDAISSDSRTSPVDQIYLTSSHPSVGYDGFGTSIVDYRRTYQNSTPHAINRIDFIERGNSSNNFGGAITFNTKALSSGTVAPVERMRIDYTGYVGIGTTAPSTQLHTTGGVRFAGIGASGSNTEILTVDGSGNVTTRASGSWTGGADNLGNHTATTDIQMADNDILDANTVQANTLLDPEDGTLTVNDNLLVNGNTTTTGDFYGDIHVDDTRSVNDPPNTYNNEVAFDFKSRSTIGVPGSGTYSGNMTIAPWGDNSGNNSHQLNFNEGGLYWRQGAPNGTLGSDWGAWQELIHSGNIGSFGDNLGNHTATTDLNMTSNNINNVTRIDMESNQSYDKLRVWNSNLYTMGMISGNSYGYLGNEYAMTFTMNNNANRGFLWRDYDDASSDGAMSLTTDGRLTVKSTANFQGSVGIGTSTPSAALQVVGAHSTTQARITLPAANNGGGTGDVNLQMWVSEPGITWDAGGIGTNVTNNNGAPAGFGRLNTSLGQSYIRFITNGGAMAFNTTNNAGTYYQTMYMTGGNVGIGLTNPSYKLHVNGRLKTTGINETSDARLKKDVTPIQDALTNVLNMKGVTYNWKIDDYPNLNLEEGLQYGLIAQELEKIIPELVDTEDNEEAWKSIEYSHLVPVLIEAIKEQQETIQSQDEKIRNMERSFSEELKSLKASVLDLETNLQKAEK